MPRPFGFKLSEETKAKMRISAKRTWTKARRKQASKFFRNAYRTGKLTPPMTGHKQTEFQKDQVSKARAGYKFPKSFGRKIKQDWDSLTAKQRWVKTLPGCIARCLAKRSEGGLKVCSWLDKWKVKYKPQFPLQRYVADIFLDDYGVILECDGSSHNRAARRIADRKRDTFVLEKFGIRTIRILEEEILEDAKKATHNALIRAAAL